MEITSTLTFVGIVIIIGGILQIVLFFKIWKMTNEVSDIKAILKAVKDILVVTNNDKPAIEVFKGDDSRKQQNGFRWTNKASESDKNSYKDMEKLLNKGQCAIRKDGNSSLKIVGIDSLCEIGGEYDVICIKD